MIISSSSTDTGVCHRTMAAASNGHVLIIRLVVIIKLFIIIKPLHCFALTNSLELIGCMELFHHITLVKGHPREQSRLK